MHVVGRQAARDYWRYPAVVRHRVRPILKEYGGVGCGDIRAGLGAMLFSEDGTTIDNVYSLVVDAQYRENG